MAVVLVGAINVAAIETVWSGLVTPPPRPRVEVQDMTQAGIELARGEEMGRFNMGSTVIVLFGKDRGEWLDNLATEQPLRMGQALGRHN
jgi:phosphatidylserine decarboxylase